jgi:hypothetical protein
MKKRYFVQRLKEGLRLHLEVGVSSRDDENLEILLPVLKTQNFSCEEEEENIIEGIGAAVSDHWEQRNIISNHETIQKYIKKWNLRKVEARRKNTGRISAYNNIRTPISLCCLMDSFQRLLIESIIRAWTTFRFFQIQYKIICKL